MGRPETHAVFRVTIESDITGDTLERLFKVESTELADEGSEVYALFEYQSSSYGYLETLGGKPERRVENVLDDAERYIPDYTGLDGDVITIDRIERY